MTRFQKELSGQLGDFWKTYAEQELVKAKELFEKADVVDGIVRWKSNGHIIMDDMAEKMELAGCIFDRTKCAEEREKETNAYMRAYIENSRNSIISEEEMYEMRSAFGRGTVVVDVISGNSNSL